MQKLFRLLFIIALLYSNFANGQRTQTPLKIATFQNGTFVPVYSLNQIKPAFEQGRSQHNVNVPGTLIDVKISDPQPTTEESVPYLVYILIDSVTGERIQFSHKLIKQILRQEVEYYIDTAALEQDNDNVAARAWKCTAPAGCGGCDPHRKGFLGLGGVDYCECTQSAGNCNFETSGGTSGFPWGPVLGLIGVLAAILAN